MISTAGSSRRGWFAATILLVGTAFLLGGGITNLAQGASASGTSIPVTKGGTGATTPTGALQNLLPNYAGNNGRVLGLTSGTVGWVDQTKNSYMTPDYSNIDSTNNHISSTGGNWKVTELGFVFLAGRADTGTASSGAGFTINGSLIFSIGSGNYASNVFPVKPGDTIESVSLSNYIFCYFIPPSYTIPPSSTPDNSYSAVEVKTADTWVDGKPIYKKTIPWVTTAVAVNADANIGTVAGIAKIVNAEVLSNDGVFNDYKITLSGTSVLLGNRSNSAWTAGQPWYITIYYTKTT
ncbi:MAG: hypothetical protein LBL84_00310 [Candidatus Nomurabacteria bacterium]|jgi:hypothetical protein|nr:hypothetical protein [Candidatus Nomurabacteria bacterium]